MWFSLTVGERPIRVSMIYVPCSSSRTKCSESIPLTHPLPRLPYSSTVSDTMNKEDNKDLTPLRLDWGLRRRSKAPSSLFRGLQSFGPPPSVRVSSAPSAKRSFRGKS
jgi:hypothetical protein